MWKSNHLQYWYAWLRTLTWESTKTCITSRFCHSKPSLHWGSTVHLMHLQEMPNRNDSLQISISGSAWLRLHQRRIKHTLLVGQHQSTFAGSIGSDLGMWVGSRFPSLRGPWHGKSTGFSECQIPRSMKILSSSKIMLTKNFVHSYFYHFLVKFKMFHGSSRDPVGHQFREAAKSIKKTTFLQGFGTFLGDFCYFPTGPNVVPKTRRLVPDWIPTGSRLVKSGAKKCKIGARLRVEWIPTGFLQKKTIFQKLRTYFWNCSTLPCTTPPSRHPPQQS